MNTLMYLACMLIWGLNFIAVKIQGTDNPLEVSLLYRSAIAFVLFFGLYWWKIRPKRQALAPKLLGTVMGFGLCSFALSYLLLYYATLYSSAAMVTLIFSLKVMVTPLLIGRMFKTPISPRVYVGGVFGIVGVAVIVLPNLHALSHSFLIGLGLAVAGTLVTAVGDTLSYYNNQHHVEPITANSIGMLTALLVLAALTFALVKPLHLPASVHYWAGLLYLALLGSFAAWLMYVYLIRSIGVVKGSYMVAFFPAIGGTASVLLGETPLSVNLVLGIGLAMVGAMIALLKRA